MNMLDLHNRYMQNITIFINDYEYQIKILRVLLKIITIDTDNPLITLMVSRLTISVNNFIVNISAYIEDMKKIVSATYLSDINHLPTSELKQLLLHEKEVLNGLIDTESIIREEIIRLIENKYIIDNLLDEESLGL